MGEGQLAQGVDLCSSIVRAISSMVRLYHKQYSTEQVQCFNSVSL
jgi:hypothetical protein